MFQYPYMNLFIFTLASSTIMVISSSHWLMVWMALELNMISFIPLISSSNWFQESEAALKYLLFQALGSSLILLSMVHPLFYSLSLLGLVVKLGAAPFHFWFPSVMKSLPWHSATLLMTWQKIAPLSLIITSFSAHKEALTLIGVLSALVGGFGGLAQTHFRPLLAYSSIGHMGWIITSAFYAPAMAILYFSLYIAISLPIMWSAFLGNIQSIKQTLRPHSALIAFITLPCVLSLSGLPPFIGFFPKLFVILSFSSPLIPLLLLLGSLINLSYYLNFFFSLLMSTPSKKMTVHPSSPVPLPLLISTWLACAPIPSLFLIGFAM